jgi:thiol:disulfide interchange protein
MNDNLTVLCRYAGERPRSQVPIRPISQDTNSPRPLAEQMKRFATRASLSLILFAALLLTSSTSGQKPSARDDSDLLEAVSLKKDLYPAGADAKKEIEEALTQATAGKKRVLLVFGANWCYDCHVLDRALHEGPAGKLIKESFLLVHVDIGEANKNLDLAKKYKVPLDKGVPAVAILGRDGDLLYTSGDGEFEAARKMMKKDLVAFLKQWKE